MVAGLLGPAAALSVVGHVDLLVGTAGGHQQLALVDVRDTVVTTHWLHHRRAHGIAPRATLLLTYAVEKPQEVGLGTSGPTKEAHVAVRDAITATHGTHCVVALEVTLRIRSWLAWPVADGLDGGVAAISDGKEAAVGVCFAIVATHGLQHLGACSVAVLLARAIVAFFQARVQTRRHTQLALIGVRAAIGTTHGTGTIRARVGAVA